MMEANAIHVDVVHEWTLTRGGKTVTVFVICDRRREGTIPPTPNTVVSVT